MKPTSEHGSERREIRRVLWLVLAGVLAGCGADKEGVQAESGSEVAVVQSSPEERAFTLKLAAIHEKWTGTPWTFSGTSQTPKEGSIACGYFVTTTLEQAGVELDRIRLAQAASETMILAIAPGESVKRFSDTSLEGFLSSVKSQGEGYYIVGLDNHTGFLRVDSDGGIKFIHSGPGRGVVVENPGDAPELAQSRYRVTGKVVGKKISRDR